MLPRCALVTDKYKMKSKAKIDSLRRAIAALKDRSNAIKKALELREKVSPYPSPTREALIKSVEADESAAAVLDKLLESL